MYPIFPTSPPIRRCAAVFAATVVLGCTPTDEHRAGDAQESAAPTPPRVAAPRSIHVKTSAPAPSSVAAADAEAFWAEYRAAALSGDTARLLPLVQFPFTTRGMMDDDPIVKHGREEFPALVARLLAQLNGMALEYGQTERQLLEETTRLPPGEVELSKDGWFRVGTFEFKRVDGGWKVVHAYTDEP
jgi:hypothetical protein